MKPLKVLILAAFPALVFAKPPLPGMNYITTWTGPFKETEITKYADYSDGVACYVYSPKSISTSINCGAGSCSTHFNGDIGSISCVKVIDGKKK